MSNKHGGKRKGAGRPPIVEEKTKPIWCGQMSKEDRNFIISALTPEERYNALMKAAEAKAES